MNIGISDIEKERLIATLVKVPGLRKAVVYGSRAKGTNKRFSDIDLTLVGDDLTYNDLNRLAYNIDDLLLPYQVDLSLYSKLKNPALIEHINRVGQVIYESAQ